MEKEIEEKRYKRVYLDNFTRYELTSHLMLTLAQQTLYVDKPFTFPIRFDGIYVTSTFRPKCHWDVVNGSTEAEVI